MRGLTAGFPGFLTVHHRCDMAFLSLAIALSLDPRTLPASPLAPDGLSLTYGLMLLHCLVGLVAAMVAQRKGYDLGRWLVAGVVGGTPVLILALTRPDLRQAP